ncbi:MAG: TlpA family protein disulfide reductase [Chitinophagaceae bacterium]
MKPIPFLFLFFMWVGNIQAQTIVQGDLPQFQGSRIELYLPMAFVHVREQSYFSPVDHRGGFIFDIPVSTPCFGYLKFSSTQTMPIFLSPGDRIHLNLSPVTGKILPQFSGPGSNDNEAYYRINALRNHIFISQRELFRMNPQAILHWFQSLDQTEGDSVRKMKTTLRLDDGFYRMMRQDSHYFYLRWLLSAADHLPDSEKLGCLRLGLSGQNFLPLNNEKALTAPNYMDLITSIQLRQDLSLLGESSMDLYGISPQEANHWASTDPINQLSVLFYRKQFTGRVLETAWASRILSSLEQGITSNLLQVYAGFQLQFPNSLYLPAMKQQMGNLQKAIQSGNHLFPGIHFHGRAAFDTINTWDQLISPYKGRVVFVDFWGTWCAPCREQMKYVPALERHFAGKKITFLYVCDENGDFPLRKWERMVKFYHLKGEHYIMNPHLAREKSLLFGPGYPGYVILDKSGDIAVRNAYRPSDRGKLYQEIEQVLQP